MPVEVVMPKLGLTMAEALIVEWKKKEGDTVRKGDILFVIETEKVTYEVESPEDGSLGKILFHEQETVAVGAVVAYLLKPGESAGQLAAAPVVAAAPAPAGHPADGRLKASPLAKKLARQYGIELAALPGTGPGGRIVGEDVEKAKVALARTPALAPAAPQPSGPPIAADLEGRLAPFTGMRRTIARRMLQSKVEAAQAYMGNTVDAARIQALRGELLPLIQKKFGVRITITDLMMKITGAALLEHPIINTRWTDNGILYLPEVHMGMAMALDEGLIVPVIKNINAKSLGQVAQERAALIEKGRSKSFLPDDITGSTFTLSAMGMFGLETFTAIINQPENAILAVGAIIEKPVAIKDQVVIRPMMSLNLTYDHRTIDGAEAGKFMRTLKEMIEGPIAALLVNSRESSDSVAPAAANITKASAGRKKIVILGGGVAGYPAAIRAARMGGEVVLIEKDVLGGTCLNRGCIPTKSLLQTAGVVRILNESEAFGVKCKGFEVDFGAVMARKNKVVAHLAGGVGAMLKAKKVRVIQGTASFLDPNVVQIRETGEKVKGDAILIASGSIPGRVPIEGIDGPDVIDSNQVLTMENLPRSAVIIGGGVIGVEFAQFLGAMCCEVTVLEMLPGIVPGMDREIAEILSNRLACAGVKIVTGAAVKAISHLTTESAVTYTVGNRTETVTAEKIILTVGRKPEFSFLDIDRVGIRHERGAIVVDEFMETNVPGIWAAGDVVGGMMLAHLASAEGECAVKNILGRREAMNYKAVPSCIYTTPEVASVGLTEEDAGERGEIRVGRFPLRGNGKALVLNETEGMVKVISESKSGRVLGVHIIGPHATDMISEAVLGITMEITAEQLAGAIHPHPTLSEAVMEAAMMITGGAIHMP